VETQWDDILPADLAIRALSGNPSRPAFRIGKDIVTIGELRDDISRYIQVYTARGIRPGTTVAVLSANRPEVVTAALANQLAGAVHFGLHPYASLEDHTNALKESGADTLIVDSVYASRASALRDNVAGLRQVLSLGPSSEFDDLTALARDMKAVSLQRPPVGPESPGVLGYTGGTTGRSKVVVLPNRVWTRMTAIQMAEWDFPNEPRFLICAPLSHSALTLLVPTLLRGGSLVVLPSFDAKGVLEAISEYRVTATMLVPTMIYALLDYPGLDEADLSSLEVIYYGASAISPARLQEAIQRFGPIFFQFYGQVEAPMTVTVLKREEHDPQDLTRLASCGRPVPWLDVALLDDDLHPVPVGEPGEICVRGPLVMKEYLNRPKETADAFRGGWLHTGDVARADERGFLTIVDRKKDMIVSGGFNVYPSEVEAVLTSHPAVSQAAVIGIPDPKWGEAVIAIVVKRAGGKVEAAELRALVKERKGSVYAPKQVEFMEALPVTGLGKIDKKALRAPYWKTAQRSIN
jgi:fatty-acyl-CoA synthase